MSLTVTVLGCSGTFAGAGNACSGYLLATDATSVWLDCGPGTLANVQEHLELHELDAVVCSHEHPDHWLELPVLVNAIRYGIDRPTMALPVYWTAGTTRLFEQVSGRSPKPAFAPTVIDADSRVTVGDISLSFSRTHHPVETLAVRADAHGRSVAYSADTGNDWELASLGPGIDVALIEASLDEDRADVVEHLTASQAGRQAARAGVASLVLTHLTPGSSPDARIADAAAVFDGPVTAATVGERYTI